MKLHNKKLNYDILIAFDIQIAMAFIKWNVDVKEHFIMFFFKIWNILFTIILCLNYTHNGKCTSNWAYFSIKPNLNQLRFFKLKIPNNKTDHNTSDTQDKKCETMYKSDMFLYFAFDMTLLKQAHAILFLMHK